MIHINNLRSKPRNVPILSEILSKISNSSNKANLASLQKCKTKGSYAVLIKSKEGRLLT